MLIKIQIKNVYIYAKKNPYAIRIVILNNYSLKIKQ